MMKVGRSLSQLVDNKRTRESKTRSVGGRGGAQAYREKSFFSFEIQGIRKSLKGDKADTFSGPKASHLSITPKPAITIQPPKKVGPSPQYCRVYLFLDHHRHPPSCGEVERKRYILSYFVYLEESGEFSKSNNKD